jgi:hypothetical protein
MPCTVWALPDGTTALVCTPRPRLTRCVVCGQSNRMAVLRLCDAPLPGRRRARTCNAPVCAEHARHVEPDTDYCPQHVALAEAPTP